MDEALPAFQTAEPDIVALQKGIAGGDGGVVAIAFVLGELHLNLLDGVFGQGIAGEFLWTATIDLGANQRLQIDVFAVAAVGRRRQAQAIGGNVIVCDRAIEVAGQVVAFVEHQQAVLVAQSFRLDGGAVIGGD